MYCCFSCFLWDRAVVDRRPCVRALVVVGHAWPTAYTRGAVQNCGGSGDPRSSIFPILRGHATPKSPVTVSIGRQVDVITPRGLRHCASGSTTCLMGPVRLWLRTNDGPGQSLAADACGENLHSKKEIKRIWIWKFC